MFPGFLERELACFWVCFQRFFENRTEVEEIGERVLISSILFENISFLTVGKAM